MKDKTRILMVLGALALFAIPVAAFAGPQFPGGGEGLPELPDMPGMPDIPEIPDIGDLPGGIDMPDGIDLPDGFEMPDLGDMGSLLDSVVCIPAGIELPVDLGLDLPECIDGQFPLDVGDPPEKLLCIPEEFASQLPENFPWLESVGLCRPGDFPWDLGEKPENLLCIPDDIAANIPEEYLTSNPWDIEPCNGEFPFDLGDPPEKLVCVPDDIAANHPDLPWLIDNGGTLRVCMEGQIPIELPEEAPEGLICIPPEIAAKYDIPYDLPVCGEGDSPFEMPEIEIPEGTVPDFVDVPEGDDLFGAVQFMADNGYMSGVGNGEFDPDSALTREQFAVLAARIGLGVDFMPSDMGDLRFPDIQEDSWSRGWIKAVDGAGLMSGFPDGTFQPEGTVTWSQAAVIAVQAIDGPGVIPPEVDNSQVWYEKFVTRLNEEGVWPCSGDVCIIYDLDQVEITRGELADLLAAALQAAEE